MKKVQSMRNNKPDIEHFLTANSGNTKYLKSRSFSEPLKRKNVFV